MEKKEKLVRAISPAMTPFTTTAATIPPVTVSHWRWRGNSTRLLQNISKTTVREHHWDHPHTSWCWSSTIDHRLVESRTTTTISTIWISHVGTIRRKWKIWSSCWLERVIRFLVTQRFAMDTSSTCPVFQSEQD